MSAIISPCGRYRYRLHREWGEGGECLFVMLNPSTADAEKDDPTIRRCIGFARQFGCGSLTVVNLYALRATHPRALFAAIDPVGPENEAHILRALTQPPALVIAAWGAHGHRSVARQKFLLAAQRTENPVWCLGWTKDGAPRHPLYVRADALLVRLEAEGEGDA